MTGNNPFTSVTQRDNILFSEVYFSSSVHPTTITTSFAEREREKKREENIDVFHSSVSVARTSTSQLVFFRNERHLSPSSSSSQLDPNIQSPG